MTETVLALDGVKFAYRRNGPELFAGLSHEFPPGRVTALTGPSGRGKSTLLYVLGLLLTPTAGHVMLNGRRASEASDGERALIRAQRVGFVFQESELDPTRRVIDSVLEPALYAGHLRKEKMGKALELLGQFGLAQHATHLPGQVSGGQAQRLAVCRALLNDADILLADEPTGNLDRDNASLVLNALMSAAHQRGRTVVVATHDQHVVNRADEVVEL